MNDFPRALYRMPGTDVQTDSGRCAYRVAVNDDDLAAAQADGWHLTAPDAKAAFDAATAPPPADPEDAPPTRAELEQKATELGLKFDGRTSDRKLRYLIAATLES